MTSINDEIAAALDRLGLDQSKLRLLPTDENEHILSSVESHFVASKNLQWWWTDFRLPSTRVAFGDQQGYERLTRIVPNPDLAVWFIAESDLAPYFQVYEADAATVQAVLAQCYAFEYYLIDKNLGWLVCETHHDVVIAIGDPVEARLRQLDAEQIVGPERGKFVL